MNLHQVQKLNNSLITYQNEIIEKKHRAKKQFNPVLSLEKYKNYLFCSLWCFLGSLSFLL